MKDPLISVIIPVYNACTYLEDCIASVIRQTMSEQIEIILIDDGSTDGSSAIADHAACSFQNMTVLHTVNHGVSAARNLGLAQAKGTYVSFVDADDYIEADYYESMLAALPPDAALVSCSFTAEYDNKQVLHAGGRCRSICGEAIIKSFLQETVLTPVVADKLFLREKVGKLRFDESMLLGEDRWFLYQYLQQADKIVIVPNGKYHYRIHPDSACRSGFSDKRMNAAAAYTRLTENVRERYPALRCVADCSEIDMKCRLYGELFYCGAAETYTEYTAVLKQEIRRFSLIKKMRYSSRKHTMALLAAKISPYLYVFLKNTMRLQYC